MYFTITFGDSLRRFRISETSAQPGFPHELADNEAFFQDLRHIQQKTFDPEDALEHTTHFTLNEEEFLRSQKFLQNGHSRISESLIQ